jgi:hypothetical protein
MWGRGDTRSVTIAMACSQEREKHSLPGSQQFTCPFQPKKNNNPVLVNLYQCLLISPAHFTTRTFYEAFIIGRIKLVALFEFPCSGEDHHRKGH